MIYSKSIWPTEYLDTHYDMGAEPGTEITQATGGTIWETVISSGTGLFTTIFGAATKKSEQQRVFEQQLQLARTQYPAMTDAQIQATATAAAAAAIAAADADKAVTAQIIPGLSNTTLLLAGGGIALALLLRKRKKR